MEKIKVNTGDYNLSFVSLLNKRVFESSSDVAYIYKNKNYSWSDIYKGSSAVAEELKKIGVKKGTHVGICGINSINWIFTFFAIQKLGGVAVLLNPALNPHELVKACAIGGVSVLCYSEIERITTFNQYKEICIKDKNIKSVFNFSSNVDFLESFNSIDNTFKENILESDDACLIIYTSGSTGKPKAVLSSAYSIMYTIKPIIDNIKHNKDDINLAFLPFFHVFGLISTIVVSLLKGFVSIIPNSKSPSELISIIDNYKVTLFNTVPTMMLAIIASHDFNSEKLSSLRSTILGGSTTTKEQMAMFNNMLPNNHFSNIYGMSENASISITKYDDSIKHITETVGRPLDGTIVTIKDSDGNILKNGEEGEICIKSGGMLVWYYKLPLDVQPIDEEGFLKTGDLGYIDSDGYIRLTGRIKDLIISGGENISPLEVTEAVLSLGCFSDVKVVGLPDPLKGEVVSAAVILKPGVLWDEAGVREKVGEVLAKYKQPVFYKVYKSFPLLESGKINSLAIINEIKKDI